MATAVAVSTSSFSKNTVAAVSVERPQTAIIDYLFVDLDWSEVTVDPDEWNEDGKRFWAAIGFETLRTIRDRHDRSRYTLMRRNRHR